MALVSVLVKGRNGSGYCPTGIPMGQFAKVVGIQSVFTDLSSGTVSVTSGGPFDPGGFNLAGEINQVSDDDLSGHLYLLIVELP